MKRLGMVLICAVLMFGCVSCHTSRKNPDASGTQESTQAGTQESTWGSDVTTGSPQVPEEPEALEYHGLATYYRVTKTDVEGVQRYEVFSKDGRTVLSDTTDCPIIIGMADRNTVKVKILRDAEVDDCQYYDVENDRLSAVFQCVLTEENGQVAYLDGDIRDSLDSRVIVVRDMFDDAGFYREYTLDLSPAYRNPIEFARFTEGNGGVQVAYLTGKNATEHVMQTLPVLVQADQLPECFLTHLSLGYDQATDSRIASVSVASEAKHAVIPAISPIHRDMRVKRVCISPNAALTSLTLPTSVVEIVGEAESLSLIVFHGTRSEWEAVKRPHGFDEGRYVICTEGAGDTSTEKTPADFASYESILATYRKVVQLCENYDDMKTVDGTYDAMFDIAGEREHEWLGGLFSCVLLLAPMPIPQTDYYNYFYQYAIKDLNGDGIPELVLLLEDGTVLALFSMYEGKPILLDTFWHRYACSIDDDGDLLVSGSGGATSFSNQVLRIEAGGGSWEEIVQFGADGYDEQTGQTRYYRLENRKIIRITEAEYEDLKKQYGWIRDDLEGNAKDYTLHHLGDTVYPLFEISESDRAVKAYMTLLANKLYVVDADGRSHYFNKLYFPYLHQNVGALLERLTYAIVDLDGNEIPECIVRASIGDLLIFHYHEGKVYVHDLIFRNADDFQQNGVYSWNDMTNLGLEYGQGRMHFLGAEMITETLWRIVDDGTDQAEYYIGNRKTTLAELQEYIARYDAPEITYLPLDLDKIEERIWAVSPEEALELASEHWGVKDGGTDHAAGTTITVRIVLIEQPRGNQVYYVIHQRKEYVHNEFPNDITHVDVRVLYVDAMTGECMEWLDEGK